jgi:hypothetical protein
MIDACSAEAPVRAPAPVSPASAEFPPAPAQAEMASMIKRTTAVTLKNLRVLFFIRP